MIELTGIYKKYSNGVEAVKDVSVTFPNSGLVFILGKSGAGKSTLLNILGGLDTFTGGVYKLFGKDISKYTAREWDEIRNYYFGFVFQDYLLLDDISVYENIAFALRLQDNNKNEKQSVHDIMQRVGIEDLDNRKINELSGGQKQRVVLARALVKNPKVILADEPTGNLDEATRQSIYKLFKQLSKEYLFIVVSHDKEAALQYADRIITIADGEIVQDITNSKNIYKAKICFDHDKPKVYNMIDEFTLDKLYDNIKEQNHASMVLSKKKIKCNNKSNNTPIPNFSITHKKQSLQTKTILDISFTGIKKHKLRVAVIINMFVLTFLLLFSCMYISFFNMNVAIDNYFAQYPQNIYSIYTKCSFTDQFYVKKDIDVKSGKYLYDLIDSVYNQKNIMGIKEVNALKDNNSEIINLVYTNESFTEKYLNMSLSKNEIALTDYSATLLGVTVGDKVNINERDYSVKKIISTDYIDYNLTNKLLSETSESIYANARLKLKYSLAYVTKQDIDEYARQTDTLDLSCANFFNSSTFSSYFNGTTTYGSVMSIDDNCLIWGRMPQNENEIAIYYEFAQYNKFDSTEKYSEVFNETLFNFKDLENDDYGAFYSEYINLFNYFPKGVKIVGVYDSCKSTKTGDMPFVVINEDSFNDIILTYYNYYYYDSFAVDALTHPTVSAELAEKNNLFFYEPIIQDLYKYEEMLNKLIIAIYIVTAILLMLSILMILSYIMFSISENAKKIGIMKALGVYNKDIIKIFIFETIFIVLLVLILSISLHIISIVVLNNLIKNLMIENAFDILYPNILSLFIVTFFATIVFFCSSFFPIFKVAKKKPMYIIRNEK